MKEQKNTEKLLPLLLIFILASANIIYACDLYGTAYCWNGVTVTGSVKIIKTDGDTIDAPRYTPVWIKNHTNYYYLTGQKSGTNYNFFEILLKWTIGDPPLGWPGTLPTGDYKVCGCLVFEGIEYTGELTNTFHWDSTSTSNVNLLETLYLHHD